MHLTILDTVVRVRRCNGDNIAVRLVHFDVRRTHESVGTWIIIGVDEFKGAWWRDCHGDVAVQGYEPYLPCPMLHRAFADNVAVEMHRRIAWNAASGGTVELVVSACSIGQGHQQHQKCN